MSDTTEILVALLLVAVNGFFVAAEFALVKVRPHRIEELAAQGRPMAAAARWLVLRLDSALAACQLGITMASLALGWVGEPAFARLLEPLFRAVGIESAMVLHGAAFAVAFTVVTALHLVVGEQFPKIFALRRPEPMAVWCALPLRAFYVVCYPLLIALSATTAALLRLFGIKGGSGHDTPHTEDELRMLLRQARAHGNLSGTEDRLIHAVFEFDDTLARRVMVPRHEVEYFTREQTVRECVEQARRSRHTRYPVCVTSLDDVVGVVHLKDLVAIDDLDSARLRDLLRPPRYVPEAMPISKLLRHFQATRHHLAFVVDEYGTVTGIVTLENVLEQIVGPVDDEFDTAVTQVVPQGEGEFLVDGGAQLPLVAEKTGLTLDEPDADTLSGLLTARLGRIVEVGDVVELPGGRAEVLEVAGSRATRVRLRVS